MIDLEEVIRRIIDIEKKAQDLIDSAKKEEDRKKRELSDTMQKLEEQIMKAAYRKVEQIRTREIEEAKKDAKILQNACANKLEQIEEQYEKYRDIWCEQLVDTVLKR